MRSAMSDYERAIRLSRGSEHYKHYTQLQLNNSELMKEIQYLSQANDLLQAENKSLRKDNNELLNGVHPAIWSVRPLTNSAVYVAGESKDMHYESSIYKSGIWDSKYANETMLEEESFGVKSYLDFHQDVLDLDQ